MKSETTPFFKYINVAQSPVQSRQAIVQDQKDDMLTVAIYLEGRELRFDQK